MLLLDALQIRLSASGTIGGTGLLEISFSIPNKPALIGLDVFGQGAFATNAGFALTNPDCKDISG